MMSTALGSRDDLMLHAFIDDTRTTMEGEMANVRERCRTYLNWYSPVYDNRLKRHDAWEDAIDWNEDAGTTRNNFPIARAVVDIWTSLEAAKPPMPRAEPESVVPPLPVQDQREAAVEREIYALVRTVESRKGDIRSRTFREWLRRDHFALKHHRTVRRKNLYGFSWTKVLPDGDAEMPRSAVMRNPTTVFPIWSDRDPDEAEAILSVQQESAVRANAKWDLGLDINDQGRVIFQQGFDHGNYQSVNDRHYDSSRTMVWVEDFWWIEREMDPFLNKTIKATVHNVVRVLGHIVARYDFPWKQLPFVYWENTDERDSYGWSDMASVLDINDEFNRRMSEEGDVLAMFSQPRFQLLGSIGEREVEMPGPNELLSLQDTERIEQILTRIDVYPAQQHMAQLIDLLHRVTGLPPIVWGLIANAQTSGRALSASWKATEARLVPKLQRNEQSLEQQTRIMLDYARVYDWEGSKLIFEGRGTRRFDDIRWKFPPMEPRDFQEVTMDAITRRDAGMTTSVKAIRDTGDEDAEETWEGVRAEFADINSHPDKVQAKLLADRAMIDNQMALQQLQQQGGTQGPQTPATVAQSIGEARQAAGTGPTAAPGEQGGPGLPPGAGGAPPGAEGAPGGAAPGGGPPGEAAPGEGSTLSSGTLVRGGDTSTQLLETRNIP